MHKDLKENPSFYTADVRNNEDKNILPILLDRCNHQFKNSIDYRRGNFVLKYPRIFKRLFKQAFVKFKDLYMG